MTFNTNAFSKVFIDRLNSEKFQNFHFQAKIVIFEGKTQKS